MDLNDVTIVFSYVAKADDDTPYTTSRIYRMDFQGDARDFEEFLKQITDQRVVSVSIVAKCEEL